MRSRYLKMRVLLPFELVEEILARVLVKDLIRFRCVCKNWRSLFEEDMFIRKHMTHAPTRIKSFRGFYNPPCHIIYESGKPETIIEEVNLNIGDKSMLLDCTVIGHCHGLFCLYLEDNTFGVWNPSLRELRRIRTRPLNKWAEMGFGYDHSTQDYKIVLVPDMEESSFSKRAQVLSLKSGVTRMIDFPCLENSVMSPLRAPGTLVGEHIYWHAYDYKADLTETILSFDLVSETFNFCPGSSVCGQKFREVIEGLSGGLCTAGIDLNDDSIAVWSVQHENENIGVIKSWSKISSLSKGMVEGSINRRIDEWWLASAITYAGLLFFLVYIGREAKLLAYNFEKRCLRNVETTSSLDRCQHFQMYVETLVPIPEFKKF